ncbi:3938_t:CDS:1, partial [Entrophospora sp. SA101]
MNLKNLFGTWICSKEYGKKGGKKFNLNAIEQLKIMFLAGNIEKSKKYSPEDMLKELQRLVETDELEAENNPFLQHHKRQA